MLVVTTAGIVVQAVELGWSERYISTFSYYWPMDLIVILFTLLELILKVGRASDGTKLLCTLALANSPQVLGNGLLLNPNAALHSLWDVVDWLTTIGSLVVMVTFLVVCDTSAHQVGVVSSPYCQSSLPSLPPSLPPSLSCQLFTFRGVHWWFRVFLLLRALRPLRILSLSPGMRGVVWDVARGWKKFLAGVILLFSFMFLFASLGVQVRQGAGQGVEK